MGSHLKSFLAYAFAGLAVGAAGAGLASLVKVSVNESLKESRIAHDALHSAALKVIAARVRLAPPPAAASLATPNPQRTTLRFGELLKRLPTARFYVYTEEGLSLNETRPEPKDATLLMTLETGMMADYRNVEKFAALDGRQLRLLGLDIPVSFQYLMEPDLTRVKISRIPGSDLVLVSLRDMSNPVAGFGQGLFLIAIGLISLLSVALWPSISPTRRTRYALPVPAPEMRISMKQAAELLETRPMPMIVAPASSDHRRSRPLPPPLRRRSEQLL